MSSVDELCRSYLDLKYHFDPSAASAAGLASHDGRLGRYDADMVRAHWAALRSLAAAVEELDLDDVQEEIDRTARLGELRSTIARLDHERPYRRNPLVWSAHLFQGLHAVLVRRDGAAAGRAPAALERLEAIPEFLDSARATLEEPPLVFVDSALAMLGSGGELIVQLAAVMSAEAPDLHDRIQAAAGAGLEALRRFGTGLRDEIEPNPYPLAFAIGEEAFNARLHSEHAILSSAVELWRYGLRLQETATEELAGLAREMGDRPWREVIDQLRDDAPDGRDDLLDTYAGELERSRRFVEAQGLVTVPARPVEIVATPPFLASLVPFAAYEPPPIFLGEQPGRFYVTAPVPGAPAAVVSQQRRGHCRHGIPAMVAHEAYPGHHLQLVTSQGLGSVVRRHIWTPVMVEGWALYCEQLMGEAGFYSTCEQRLFQLANLLWRAVRVVLDVGLHTRRMTPLEAVDYMVQHLPIERRSAEAEVRRYCAYPTYQLCYAVGRRELLRLRQAYQERAGSGFELRRFHDAVLAYGGLPVSLARWGMDLAE